MNIIVAIPLLIFSFYIMSKVIDGFFIKSLDNIADSLKLSPSVAGATLLAFGTSAPEISTNMFALILVLTGLSSDTADVGIGTIVGSAIFQILVVIGFASVVRTSFLDWKPVVRDITFYLISIIILIFAVRDGTVDLYDAVALVGCYVIYLAVMYFWNKQFKEEGTQSPLDQIQEVVEIDDTKNYWRYPKKLFKFFLIINKPVDYIFSLIPDVKVKKKLTLPLFFLSLIIIGFLSYVLVLSAESIAHFFGVPSAIIALTILAGGTSVPELIASAIVSKEGRGDMAISNAIGSNVFDILMSYGFPVLIFIIFTGHPIENVGSESIISSIFLLFATVVAVSVLLITQKFKAGRGFGLVLIFIYVVYVIAAYGGII